MAARTVRRPVRTSTKPAEPDEADYEDDPEDEERPRRGASRPARRSAPTRTTPRARDEDPDPDDEDDKPRSRRRGKDDDDEDDKPTRRAARGGWGQFREDRAATSSFAELFKVEYKQRYLIKILDDEPFAAYRQHWIDELPKKKSWICIGEGCALCEQLSDQPKPIALFNVLEFVEVKEKGKIFREPHLKVWEVGSGVGSQLEDIAEGDEGPLTDGYWKVSKAKSGGRKGPTTYSISKVKDRDLGDDFDTDPLEEDEIDEFLDKAYQSDYVKYPSKRTLQEIAEDLLED